MSIFENKFTNVFSLSKTLRFELEPVGGTKRMLEENMVFKKDELILKKYEATKPFIDRLHREFVVEALSGVRLEGLREYFDVYCNWRRDKNDKLLKKGLESHEKMLREQIVGFFNKKALEYSNIYDGFGKKNVDLLFEDSVFEKLLKVRYGNEDGAFLRDSDGNFEVDENGNKISIFDSWKGFVGYFRKFFKTRENFYKSDGTSTAIATRIVDQNLRRFCENICLYNELKVKLDFSEVENSYSRKLEEIFDLEFYSKCLLQDGIDWFNKILGGETLESGEKIKGLNEVINLSRQQTGEKLKMFIKLDKQILSEKVSFIDEIESEEELIEELKEFRDSVVEKFSGLKRLFSELFLNTDKFDLNGVFISKEGLNTIAYKWTENAADVFNLALFEVLKEKKLMGSKDKDADGGFKFPDFVSLEDLKNAVNGLKDNIWKERYFNIIQPKGINEGGDEKSEWEKFLIIFNFEFNSLFSRKVVNVESKNEVEIGFNVYLKNLDDLLRTGKIDTDSKSVIKDFADNVLCIYQISRYFALEKKRKWVQDYEMDVFYTNLEYGYLKFYEDAYEKIVKPYNRFRNFLTRKPYSQDKWKLNFGVSNLGGGWDKNKEQDYLTLIFKKDGNYFVGIMDKRSRNLFDDKYIAEFDGNGMEGSYSKLVYKLFPDPAKMFPKVCFSAKGLEFFQPSEEIMKIYNGGEFKNGDNFSVESMQKLIDFYKDCLTRYEGWKGYEFRNLKPTKEYVKNIGEFYNDVAIDGYKLSFQSVSEEYIKKVNEEGKLYLFRICSKDFSSKSTGKKNLHSLYFESLFSEENFERNFVHKLSGGAELFFRPKTEVRKLG